MAGSRKRHNMALDDSRIGNRLTGRVSALLIRPVDGVEREVDLPYAHGIQRFAVVEELPCRILSRRIALEGATQGYDSTDGGYICGGAFDNGLGRPYRMVTSR